MKRWIRVPRPTPTISRPVATGPTGPRGPPCPPWRPCRACAGSGRRRRVRWRRPACRRAGSRRSKLRGELLADELHELVELEVGGEARGAAVAPAAQGPRDDRDVDAVVRRAQGHLAGRFAVELLAHEARDRGALDR